MKILYLGNPLLAAALKEQGHAVFTAAPQAGVDWTLQHPITAARLLERVAQAGLVPDALLYMDNGNLPLLLDPENLPCASLWYSIDTYCNPWHVPYAHGFDHVLVGQKDFVPLFTDEGLAAQWFPLFCILTSEGEPFAARDIPVSFVGTLGHKNNPEREPFLKEFRRHHPLVMLQGAFEPIFRRSRIVLNQTAFSELNFRCFEVMGLGAALLMEDCGNGLRELFTPGETILPPYRRGQALEAARTAAQALARPEELARIAAAGRQAVQQAHTDTVRARQLTALLEELLPSGKAARRLKAAAQARVFVHTAFSMIASELSGPEWERHRIFFQQMGAL